MRKFAWRYRDWVLVGAVLAVGQISGAVKLSPLALGFLFLFCLLLLYGYREMAARGGQVVVSKWLFWIVGGIAVLSALVIAVVKPEWNSNIHAGTEDLAFRAESMWPVVLPMVFLLSFPAPIIGSTIAGLLIRTRFSRTPFLIELTCALVIGLLLPNLCKN
jgi:hypothetical protein